MFLLIPACPLEMFVSQALSFYCGAVGGKLGKNEESFKRAARACLPFLKFIIPLLCQPSAPGVSGKYLALGGTMGPGQLGPSWVHGCWLPPICQKSQARGFSQPTAPRPPTLWGSLAVDCLGRFHSSWASKETSGPRANVASGFPSVGSGTRLEIWVPSEAWRVPAFPWCSGPEAPTYFGMVS